MSEVTGDFAYTAMYSETENVYQVLFDASEGVLSESIQAFATYGSTFILSQTASKTEYTFSG